MDNITKMGIYPIVKSNSEAYGKELALNRAFPSVVDGQKPVQRALLYALYEISYKKDNRYVKSATACARVSGHYHPHGDDTVYETAVALAEDTCSLIDPQSRLSTRVTTMPTAKRYTNIRLSPLGSELFSTLDFVDMVETFTGIDSMPKVLFPRFPVQLLSYYVNIGFGFSSTLLPFNAKEVLDATILMTEARMKGFTPSAEALAEIILGPDLYPNHKIYMSRESLVNLIENGTGTLTVVCDIIYDEETETLEIKELPFKEKAPNLAVAIKKKADAWNRSTARELKELEDKDWISGIKEDRGIINNSSESNISIKIKVDTENGFDYRHVLEQLYNKTNLKRTFNIEFFMVNPEGTRLNLYSPMYLMEQAIDVNIRYFRNLYQKQLDKLEYDFMVNKVLEKVTREENQEWIGKAIYKKEKHAIFADKGFTTDETKIIFTRNVLDKFSKREEILKELAEFESRKAELLERMKEENLLKDTLDHFKSLESTLDYERKSEIIYSPLSKVTPKIRVIEKATSKLVVVTDNWSVFAVPNSPKYQREVYGRDTRYIYELTEDEFVVVVTENYHIKVPVKDLTDEKTPIMVYLLNANTVESSNRILNTFPQYASPDGSYVWYFVNNKGEIKTVNEMELASKTTVTKGTPNIPEDMKVVAVFRLPVANASSTKMFMYTKKGFAKLIEMDLFKPKNRASGFNRFTRLEEDDEILTVSLVEEGFKLGQLVTEADNGLKTTFDIYEDDLTMPILNRGRRLQKSVEVIKADFVYDSRYIPSGLEFTWIDEQEVIGDYNSETSPKMIIKYDSVVF